MTDAELAIADVERHARDGMNRREIMELAAMLFHYRRKHNVKVGCLRPGGCGIDTWILSRLRERMHAKPHKGPMVDESRANRLFVLLHFWSWDVDRYGPWSDRDFQPQLDTTARSPVHRIATLPAEPIDTTAWRVDRQNDRR